MPFLFWSQEEDEEEEVKKKKQESSQVVTMRSKKRVLVLLSNKEFNFTKGKEMITKKGLSYLGYLEHLRKFHHHIHHNIRRQ